MPTTDSDPEEGTLGLVGVWLHDPLDPESTAVNYIYGSMGREQTVDAGGAGTLYAGRTYPVMEYGEHEQETVNVGIVVPHGPTHAADLETLDGLARAKRTLWYRDNRGRSFAATIAGYRVQDQRYGTVVGLVVERVHYAEEEVAA